jgi:formylmethanofuran dehydrogenase subunit B
VPISCFWSAAIPRTRFRASTNGWCATRRRSIAKALPSSPISVPPKRRRRTARRRCALSCRGQGCSTRSARSPSGCRESSRPDAAIAAIAERLAAARYGAIVWHPASFARDDAELAIERIAAILRHLNIKTRCVGLPLGGSGNGIGAMQAALWQAGWPLRLGFADGIPRHDPWRFDARRLLASGEADLLVWAATLMPETPPPTDVPVIAIVSDDIVLAKPAAVEIRVGIPAIDHPGAVFRSDTVIALPLQATRPSDRPSVADAAEAILAQWEAAP